MLEMAKVGGERDRFRTAVRFQAALHLGIPATAAYNLNFLFGQEQGLGYQVIVDNSHRGMVYKDAVFQKLHTGRPLKGYIKGPLAHSIEKGLSPFLFITGILQTIQKALILFKNETKHTFFNPAYFYCSPLQHCV